MKKDIYLTFKTDFETHWLLKEIAHKLGKTQPELINEICKDFLEKILEEFKKYQTDKSQTDE